MSRFIHFYQASSRIGLVNPPIYSTVPNNGVEFGPDNILSPKFLKNFPRYKIEKFDFSTPEQIEPKTFNKTLSTEIQAFRTQINQTILTDETQVVLGGDHSVTLPSVLAVLDRLHDDDKLLYLQFDSHGDCNLNSDSPTGNFHGMYLRPLFGQDFDIPEISNIVNHQINSKNIFYFGNLDLDRGESDFFAKHQIQNFSVEASSNSKVLQQLQNATKTVSHIHISFDVDCLDHSIAPATGIPAAEGFLIQQLTPIFECIKYFPSVSIDLVEYNPTLPGAEKTLNNIHRILNTLLQP